MLHTLRECREVGTGTHDVLDIGPPQLLIHRATADTGCMLFLHNLAKTPCRIGPPPEVLDDQPPLSVAADGDYGDDIDPSAIDVNGYGYRWIRLRRQP